MAARKSSGKAVARSRTEFLNIDLDLVGAADLDELARALFPTLIVVHQEPGRIGLELSHQPKDADGGIVELAGVLTRLARRRKQSGATARRGRSISAFRRALSRTRRDSRFRGRRFPSLVASERTLSSRFTPRKDEGSVDDRPTLTQPQESASGRLMYHPWRPSRTGSSAKLANPEEREKNIPPNRAN